MTEAEFCKHFEAVTNAIPETNVSPRQAALSCLDEFRRLQSVERAALRREIVIRELGVQMHNAANRLRAIDAAEKAGPQTEREVGMVERVMERVLVAPLRLVQAPGQLPPIEVTHRLVYVECGCGRRFTSGELPVKCCGKEITDAWAGEA